MKKMIPGLVAVLAGFATAADASDSVAIFTGGAPDGTGSSYHEGIGQGVEDMLQPIAKKFGYTVTRVPTSGAVDNVRRVSVQTETLAFGIGQGGLSYPEVESGKALIIRNDLPGECAMAFTREPKLTNWKSIIANARRVTWVVPEKSGSEAFIRKLFATDPNFAGVDPKFAYTSGQKAILAALKDPSNRGYVGFFYAYPNPASGTVRAAADAELNVIGVLSPEVAKSDEAFYLNRRAPYQLSLFGFGTTKTVRAMCSKALLFASNPAAIADDWSREDAEEMIKAVKAAPSSAFVPKNGALASIMLEVEGLSEEYGVSEMADDLAKEVEGVFE
ncbi:MAG: hypothetical protein AAGC81_09920 [Pseudomonadota bacterium]